MANILGSIRTSLTPVVTAVGFEPSDHASWKDLAWVEYRRQDAEGITLLGVVWIPAEGMVTAEMWRPDRLAERLSAGYPDGAIEWQQAWHCDPGENVGERGREVAAGIIARLTGLGASE